MNSPPFRRSNGRRWTAKLRGATLVELLVVLGIIALLLAMLLSGVQAARDAYKRLERLVGQASHVDQQSSQEHSIHYLGAPELLSLDDVLERGASAIDQLSAIGLECNVEAITATAFRSSTSAFDSLS